MAEKPDRPPEPFDAFVERIAKSHDLRASDRQSNAGLQKCFRRPAVEQITGLSRSTIYDWMKRGTFPQPVKLGARAVAWRESDIVAWLESREEREA